MENTKTKYEILTELLAQMVKDEKLPEDIIAACIKEAEEKGIDEAKDDKKEKSVMDQMIDAFTEGL
ncbi:MULTISPECIES: hypothetical protein [unclassified Enterococcus]|uniref:hypothetical protein n=1 Tax=unclassified Enterococcus TaxID=2608891 RepID=UPI00155802F3|nr:MULTISPECIES: hypothetical protein [unclassified Enterococcus]MBS7576841.1 hypothetical protein [Enterococcus sp. MMGLQ5-2]MBS7584248.1 hypothetical protein [Enterococcus sp. MMGLQ5-1]NPD12104.1 hypothetical protein [Enterococcus sp. MMGLQ5-1]NPD36676.1 hypothetical protein [Enterococcus sp. MMGLQ5-2]